MSQMLELPDPIFAALREAARSSGTTPAGWIAARLPAPPPTNGQPPEPMLADDEIARANARLRQHIVDLGVAVGCENEQIDADLARAYGNDHADRDRPARGP